MLLQGQDDAVGNNCSQDHVLKWSVRVKEQLKVKLHSFHSNIINYSMFSYGISIRINEFTSSTMSKQSRGLIK